MAIVTRANRQLINRVLREKGMRQMDLAEKCKMTRQNLNQFLLQKQGLSQKNLRKIAWALDLAVEDLTL